MPRLSPTLMRTAWRAIARLASVALASTLLASSISAAEPAAATARPDAALELFERHVRPVLVETCQKCHGPTKQESDLRVDSREALLRGGLTAPAVVPGKPEESLLVAAIRQADDLKMPPKGKLGDDKIEAITQWIKLGAPWPKADASTTGRRDPATHWAFQPVRDSQPPTIQDRSAAPHSPIDAFVQAKRSAAGLKPSPPADRRTLIRRATIDLSGLPPSPDDVDAFMTDSDPRAYERLVDRLLASPRYGEQWGRHWLDVARYADTKGYVYAREHRFWLHAWAYRDWVVKSLNDDLPYDRFLLLQIAADQVAPNDRAAQAAMGFLTLGRRFLGVTHDIIDDRIDVVGRGTMGLTIACARCHDHKFDPIPTRDYYSLYGVFRNAAERRVRVAQPTVKDEAHRQFETELQKRQAKLDATRASRRAESAARVRARVGDYLLAQLEMQKYPEEGFDQAFTKDDILPAFVRRWQTYLWQARRQQSPIFAPWFAYSQLKPEEFAARTAEITAGLAAQTAGGAHPLVIEQFRDPPKSIQEVARRYSELFTRIEAQWQAALKEAADKKASAPTALADANAESLRQVLYGRTAPCEVPDEDVVHIDNYFDLSVTEELWRLQSEVDAWLVQSPLAPAYAVVLEDRDPLTPAQVFKRGRPSNQGEEAPRQFLSLLSGPNRQPFQHGSGRLELAQAIADPHNPLTARVIANRVWLHHFGSGLVRTPSDFGTRAEPPSHPELLDWLASRLIEDGWSLKQLHRRIMLSDTYCQAATGPADEMSRAKALQTDPDNRLLWRMNDRRLTFEEMRDSLFAATGELDLATGGKPADMFAATFNRRTLYGLVDRQFLPNTLRVFDFANPDLHIPLRSDTTVSQQALFFLNDELLIGRAKSLARRTSATASPEARVAEMYRLVYQRSPTPRQLAAALALIESNKRQTASEFTGAADWQYGFAAIDPEQRRTSGFVRLPHFTGSAWQGGAAWPDAKLGWVQLTATGGHAGNDLQHAAVRRWTAPRDMTVSIRSTLAHDLDIGDGVRGWLFSSRHGFLKSESVRASKADINVDTLEVKAGDTLDFAVDIGGTLNNDQFTWEATIAPVVESKTADAKSPIAWNSRVGFQGGEQTLDAWEQLAQVLFAANEFLFVD